jgi:hypothetical protein
MLAATCALLRSPLKEPNGEGALTPPPACWAPHGNTGAASACGAGAHAAADDSALPLLPPLTLRSAVHNLRCHVTDTLLDVYAAHLAFVTQARCEGCIARVRTRARGCTPRARADAVHTHARVRALCGARARASSSPRRRCLWRALRCSLSLRSPVGLRTARMEAAGRAAWCPTSTGPGSPVLWSSRCAWPRQRDACESPPRFFRVC